MHNWLLTSEAQNWLDKLAGKLPTPALILQLRKNLTVEQAGAIAEQLEMRPRGVAKFRHAANMFFTRTGYEQSTDEAVARYKAKRFTGRQQVLDFCCGIGGDLSGFAANGISAIGIECQPALAAFAAHNAKLFGDSVTSRCQYGGAEELKECDAWHADPDRRVGGRRSTSPDTHEPSLETLTEWRSIVPHAAIKFAPASRLPEEWEESCELEWISRAGECRQLVAWCGDLALAPGMTRATRLPKELAPLPCSAASAEPPEELSLNDSPASFLGQADLPVEVTSQCSDYLFEPDPAVLAAHLSGALSEEWGLTTLTQGIAYLTGPKPIDHPLLACFRIEEHLSYDRKKLSRWLAERSIGQLEIKCRGVDVEPKTLRKKLKLNGSESATLVIAPTNANRNKPQVFVCQRVE